MAMSIPDILSAHTLNITAHTLHNTLGTASVALCGC